MNRRRRVVLDLGGSKVVAIAARTDGKDQLLLDAVAQVASMGLHRGAVVDPAATAEAIKAAVDRVSGEIGETVSRVSVGLSGIGLRSHTTQGMVALSPPNRAIRTEDVLQVIAHSKHTPLDDGMERLLTIPREFRVDGGQGVPEPIGQTGSRLEVTSVVLGAEGRALEALEWCLDAAGLEIDHVVPAGLATGLAVNATTVRESACLALDIGASTTEYALFLRGGFAAVGAVPIGGEAITNDLRLLLKVTGEEAERLKVRYGSAKAAGIDPEDVVEIRQEESDEPRLMQRRVLSEIIESRVREIGKLVRERLERDGFEDRTSAALRVAGGTAGLADVAPALAEAVGSRSSRVSQPKVDGRFGNLVENPASASAVGLALYALELDDGELAPASGLEGWRDRFRALNSVLGVKTSRG